jgi:hypothetical protein
MNVFIMDHGLCALLFSTPNVFARETVKQPFTAWELLIPRRPFVALAFHA